MASFKRRAAVAPLLKEREGPLDKQHLYEMIGYYLSKDLSSNSKFIISLCPLNASVHKWNLSIHVFSSTGQE